MVNNTFTYTTGALNNIFNDPFFIGFQPNLQTWAGFGQQETYPPYNVVKKDEDTYFVQLALAGFDKSDLDITVDKDTLTVKGERDKDESEYQHKGIATRSFKRSFALGEYMEVTGAEFKNGMLSITVERIVPEDKKPKSIRIK